MTTYGMSYAEMVKEMVDRGIPRSRAERAAGLALANTKRQVGDPVKPPAMPPHRRPYELSSPRRTPNEKEEERKAMRLMTALGFTCWHLSQNRASRQTPGWPDMLFTCPAKRLSVYYEAKSAKGKQSDAQKAFQADIVACGHEYVVGTVEAMADWCVAKGIGAIKPA